MSHSSQYIFNTGAIGIWIASDPQLVESVVAVVVTEAQATDRLNYMTLDLVASMNLMVT